MVVRRLLGLFSGLFLISGCVVTADISKLPAVDSVSQSKVYFQTTSVSLSEGSFGIFNILASEVQNEDIEVDLVLSGPAGRFQALPKSLTIPKGSLSASFTLQTIDDSIYQGDAVYSLEISSSSSALTLEPNKMTIQLADNEVAPIVAISDISVNEAAGTAVLTLTQNSLSSLDSQILWSTTDNTAVAGIDYGAASAQLVTIAAGSLSKQISVSIIDNAVFNSNKDFFVNLSTAIHCSLANSQAKVTIVNDDATPHVQFALVSSTQAESVGTVNILLSLDQASGAAVIVPWTLSGTATLGAGNDYTVNTTSPLTIPAGQTSATISVTISDDSLSEASETAIFTLGTPTNAVLGTNSTHTLTITDNDLGFFNITGITGAGDALADAYLSNGLLPQINWGASTGATSYDVTIYASDGTTVACATQNTASTNFTFSTCPLTLATNYKTAVVAKAAGLTNPASNSMYSFYVNRSPVANSDGPVRIMKNSALINLQVVTGSDSTSRGTVADSDPDAGDTFSITSVTQGTSGGTVAISGNSVNYTVASSTFTGVETFSYTLTDNHGGVATATVTIHVMDTYTWTGKVSANWNVNGNWCGTITNNSCNGSSGYPNNSTTATHLAIFDGTCLATGHSCSASINTAVQAYKISLNTGYSGTLTQISGAGNTLDIGSGGYVQASGTFVGGSAAISLNGPLAVSAGSFTMPNANVSTLSNWSVTGTGTLVATSGTLIFGNGSWSLAHSFVPGTGYYNNVSFSGYGSSYNLGGGTLNINGTLFLYDSYNSSGSISSGTIKAFGNVSVTGTGLGGNGLLQFAGNSGGQTLTSSSLANVPNIEIKTGTYPFTLSGSIQLSGNWTYTSSGTFTTTGSKITMGNGSGTYSQSIVPGPLAYNDFMFNGWQGTYNLNSGTLNVLGTLTFADGTGGASISSGTINSYGNIVSTGIGVPGGNVSLVVAGNPSGQTITGAFGSYVPSITIAAGANPVTLSGYIATLKNWTYLSSGTFTTTGSKITLGNGSGTYSQMIVPGPVAYNDFMFNGWQGTYNLNSGTLNVLGTLTFADGTGGASINSGTINSYGNIVSTGIGVPGGNVSLVVAGNPSGQTITGAFGSYVPSITIAAGANPVTLSGYIATLKNWTYLSSGTFTTTGSNLIFGNGSSTVSQSFQPGLVTYNNVTCNGWQGTYTLIGTSLALSGTLSLNDGYSNTGKFYMNGQNLTAASVSLNNNTLYKNSGTLTVGGSAAGTGSLFGGTVNP